MRLPDTSLPSVSRIQQIPAPSEFVIKIADFFLPREYQLRQARGFLASSDTSSGLLNACLSSYERVWNISENFEKSLNYSSAWIDIIFQLLYQKRISNVEGHLIVASPFRTYCVVFFGYSEDLVKELFVHQESFCLESGSMTSKSGALPSPPGLAISMAAVEVNCIFWCC